MILLPKISMTHGVWDNISVLPKYLVHLTPCSLQPFSIATHPFLSLIEYGAHAQHQTPNYSLISPPKMSTRTTNDIVNDTDEPKWTCRCNQFFNLDEPELPTTTLFQGLRTRWSDPAYERDCRLYLIYLLGGVFCLLVVIIVLAEIYWDIEWLLS
jgi:hypothetical protein